MKKILIIILLTAIVGCNSDTKTKNETTRKTEIETGIEAKGKSKKDNISTPETNKKTNVKSSIISSFLSDISSLENNENQNPIVSFQEAAENDASKSLVVSKDNMENVLSLAKDYNHCIITTEDHTIVKIDNTRDCKQSGSWGACMPFVTGYIKKGTLVLQEDYMNNIIGLPDSKVRMAYFFD